MTPRGLTTGLALAAILLATREAPARPVDTRSIGKALPNHLSVIRADGEVTNLSELLALEKGSLAIVRVQAEWCGPCRWHAGDTRELLRRFGKRVRVIDIVLADEDNQPASVRTIASWRARVPASVTVVADPTRQLIGLLPPPAPLPWIFIVDGRTLAIRDRLSAPDPEALAVAIQHALGDPTTPASPSLVDGIFARDQWEMIRDMRLPARPPADPSNRVADDPAAASLGRQLFTDRLLSPSGRVACISCHDPALVFTNGKDTAAEGVGPGHRNVPSLVLASHARWQLWDGRADSLWAQAVLPFEDPTEFGSSRLFVAHAVFARHRSAYEAVFGALPLLGEARRFPPQGKPGDAAWEAMDSGDREAVTRVLANVGKAIAAFERSLQVKPNALDRYATGERDALTRPQKEGLRAFFTAGCAQCHYGPRLTDDAFHNLRLPTGRQDKAADRGRADGIPILVAGEFSRSGPFSDRRQRSDAPRSDRVDLVGAFKTPSLRGVPFTMPYGHGGGFGGLASIIEAHRTGGMPPGSRFAAGDAEPWAQGFDASLEGPIAKFLGTLSLEVDGAGVSLQPEE